MLIVDVLVDEFRRLELLQAVLDQALVDLAILQDLRLDLRIVLFHVSQNFVILRGHALTGTYRQTLACRSYILVFKDFGSSPLRLPLDHPTSDPFSVP